MPKFDNFFAYFAEAVDLYPKNNAIVNISENVSQRSDQITYQDLYSKVLSCEVSFLEKGISTSKKIVVALSRSINLFTVMLASMKMGVVFIPIDLERNEILPNNVDYNQIEAIIVDDDSVSNNYFKNISTKIKFLNIKNLLSNLVAPSLQKPSYPPKKHPVYIMYTSGSSGNERKGVVVGAEGLPYCFEAHIQKFNVTNRDRIAQLASPSFDAFIVEMMMALGTGACLYLVPSHEKQSLNDFYYHQQITVGIFTPAILQLLNAQRFDAQKDYLRAIAIVGESFSRDLVRSWSSNGRNIFNGYGLTETTICATLSLIKNDITLGQPIESAKFYFTECTEQLMDQNEITPIKIEHEKEYANVELLIAGPCLAIEYWELPELTSAKFKTIRDPVNNKLERVYRTGDIVSVRLEKNNEYKLIMQGRSDNIIKIDGERVDVSILEKHLIQEKEYQIDNVCIIQKNVTTNGRLDKFLVCYMSSPIASLSIEHQRKMVKKIHENFVSIVKYRKKVIPAPAHFVFINNEKFPIRNNDKRSPDKKLLVDKPLPFFGHGFYEAAQTNYEKKIIIKIINDILPYGESGYQIGINESFEDMGFRSLHYTMFIEWLEKEFPVKFKFSDLFLYSTTKLLANYIERKLDTTNLFVTLSSKHKMNLPKLYVFHSIFGDAQLDYARLDWDSLPFEVIGVNSRAAKIIPHSIPLITNDYLRLILENKNTNHEIILGGYSSGGLLAIDLAKQMALQGIKVKLILFDTIVSSQKLPAVKVLSHLFKIISSQMQISYDEIEGEFKKKLNIAISTVSLNAMLTMLLESINRYKTNIHYNKVSNLLTIAQKILTAEENYTFEIPEVPVVHFASMDSISQFGPVLGWQESHSANVVMVDNVDHFNLMQSRLLINLLLEHISTETNSKGPPSPTKSHIDKSWELPLPNDRYFARSNLDLRIIKFFKEKNLTNNTLKILVLYGLSGTGKSQAALNYLSSSRYKFKAWFQADSLETLKQNYILLGRKYKIIDDKSKFDSAVDKVIQWLSEQDSLLIVYDNLAINTFPEFKKIIPYGANSTHIIITSENGGWETNVSVSAVEVQSLIAHGEAEKYIENFIVNKDNLNDTNAIKYLVKKTAGLPLALNRACAFINECQISIAEYNEQFKVAEEAMLSYQGELPDHLPVRLTWAVILNTLKQNLYLIKLLNIMAFFNADELPEYLLIKYLKINTNWQKEQNNDIVLKTNFEISILKELRRFSLVTRHPIRRTVSIHRLFRDVLYLELNVDERKQYLTQLLDLLDKEISEDVYANEKDWNKLRLILPHAKHAAKQAIREGCQIETAVNIRLKIGRYRSITERGYTYGILIYKKALNELKNSPNSTLKAKVLLNLGTACVGAAKFEESILYLKESLDSFTSQHNHDDYVKALNTLGNAYLNAGDYTKALEQYSEALLLSKTAKPEELPRTLLCIGAASLGKKDFANAEIKLNQARMEFIKIYDKQHVRVAETDYFLGVLQCQQRNYSSAEETFRSAYQIFLSKDNGAKNIDTAQTLTYLGWSKFLQKKYPQALIDTKSALDIFNINDLHGNYHRAAMAFLLIFLIYDRETNHELAEKTLKEMLEFMSKYGKLPIITSIVQGTTPHYAWEYIQCDGDITYINKCFEMVKKLYGENSFHCAYLLYKLSQAYIHVKDYNAADKCIDLSLDVLSKEPLVEGIYRDLLQKCKSDIAQIKKSINTSMVNGISGLVGSIQPTIQVAIDFNNTASSFTLDSANINYSP